MGLYHLKKIFDPQSIAVIGASSKEGTVGYALLKNLTDGGFEGDIFPINPNHSEVQGRKAYKSIQKVDREPDLALIATPIQTVPDVMRQCADKGIGGAIIISAGGKESGEKGQKIEQEIETIARENGIRVVGPNCLGIIRPGKNLNASFAPHLPSEGQIAFLSQSGAICTSILDLSVQEGFGFSHFVSTGSMLDVDFGDLIDFFGNDYRVQSILLYVENLTHFRKFMSAARAVSRIKPIVVLKAGRSGAGAKAAASHTGAMAGSDDAYDAAFKRAGIVRVDTIGELFDCAELLAKQPRPGGNRIGIITNGGGPGVMAADALAKYGLQPAELPQETKEKLNEVLPPYWSHGNPIDVLGDTPPEGYAKAVQICMESKAFDGLLALFSPQALSRPTATGKALVERFEKKRFPVVAAWMGGVDVAEARELLNKAQIPTYGTPEDAIRAFMYLYEYGQNLEALRQVPPKLSGELTFDRERAKAQIQGGMDRENRTLTEIEAKELLKAYGLPVNRTEKAASAQEAVEKAEDMGYPVVLKILSPDISHKTDANGVALDLRNSAEVEKAFDGIMAAARDYSADAELSGVTVQPMLPCGDFEILIGAKKDANFGPMILFGLGGIYTEVLKDRALGLPPLNRTLARRLMSGTKIYTLLSGYRGRKADLESIEEMLIRLSQLVMDFPEIAELDMNPVIIHKGKAEVVDARIIVEETETESPRHLVISPYPQEHERQKTTDEGLDLFVRPIIPEDAPLLQSLFDVLSPTSIYRRFFSHVSKLTPEMMARFTQIDYDREMALVAITQEDGEEKMVGVARIIGDPDGEIGEFSVLVGDPWQNMGVGGTLLGSCLEIMKQRCMKRVWGLVLPENRGMIRLGKKLGFKTERSEDGELQLAIDLTGVECVGI